MTNPNNAIGTNAAYSGRTSVNAFNDDLAAYSRGILTGWNCQVDTGLTVILGGGHSVRDVAIAEDNAGNKTTINNISLDEVPVTLDTAPGANSRIDLIVAYVDNPPQGSDSTADNPEACGIIPVAGTPAVSPQAPDDNAIRTAITADGASGTTAYYVILAKITVPTGTTDLIPGYIEQGDKAVLNANQIADGSIASSKIDFATFERNSTPTDGYYQMGDLLICWGYSLVNIQTSVYSETTKEFTFPKKFANIPSVMAACGDIGGTCGEYIIVPNISTTKANVVLGHSETSQGNHAILRYFAIGIAAE